MNSDDWKVAVVRHADGTYSRDRFHIRIPDGEYDIDYAEEMVRAILDFMQEARTDSPSAHPPPEPQP